MDDAANQQHRDQQGQMFQQQQQQQQFQPAIVDLNQQQQLMFQPQQQQQQQQQIMYQQQPQQGMIFQQPTMQQQQTIQMQPIGNQMVMPQAPMMMYQQPVMQLETLSPEQKLDMMTQAYIRDGRTSGCSDLQWCGLQTVSWDVTNSQAQFKSTFTINQDPPSNCQDVMGGKIQDYTINQQGQTVARDLYQIEHDRNNCCLKSCCGWEHIIGLCNYLLLKTCFPSKSKLMKNGQTLANYRYGCCGDSMDIYDGNMNKKYHIESEGCFCERRNRFIKDGAGQIVPIQANSLYFGGKNKKKVDTTITFGNNNQIQREDKMALIFGMAKLV